MRSNLRLPRSRGSRISLDKFLKSTKNLSKPSPKLWPDDPRPEPIPSDEQGLPILDLRHPLLQKLESSRSVAEFDQIYVQIVVSGLLQYSLAAGRVIKKLCSGFGLCSRAVSVIDSIDEADVFMGNTILRCFVNSNDPLDALGFYYGKMVARCLGHNHYTFPLLTKVCAEIGSVKEGEKIHSLVLKYGFESDLYVRNSLIHMYAVCGRVRDARNVFDGGSVLDLVSWNSMIDGYVKNGDMTVARELFDEMPERDVFSWNSMVSGYAGIQDMEAARYLFERMHLRDTFSWNSMIDGYAKAGNVVLAREFFNRNPKRSVGSWNIVLALYVRVKDYVECLRLFEVMLDEGECKPNEASIVSVLTACANLRRLDTGKWIHSYIRSNGIKPDLLLSTSLLTMYAKCGAVDMARDIFDTMQKRSIVSWSSMIMGYGMHGYGEKAVEMFLEMEDSDDVVVPDVTTFICVLSACVNAGMFLEGWWFFDRMCRVYKIKPGTKHYGCMVDLLGRAGLTKDSEDLTRKTRPLLSSCFTHADTELGRILAEHLIRVNPNDVGHYVLLSHIYALEGKWEEVEGVRRMMNEKNLQIPAMSGAVRTRESKSAATPGTYSSYRERIIYSMLCEMGDELKAVAVSENCTEE
ncbi:PREDICTED: pentatricopeptide repeat-containing protein At3g29230-like [Tarenaya hassleriana]|uniref:pentatricopeptide repeat-containing protein At3g29230-like n=1 Tax=Tarenaya hassleriana TaxID=28532 RepID=UPI00053C5AFF|nr:PREDICTED: pentatricopeptide repeat-containing protein At3g29230-like [Tarenaya hassleriana]